MGKVLQRMKFNKADSFRKRSTYTLNTWTFCSVSGRDRYAHHSRDIVTDDKGANTRNYSVCILTFMQFPVKHAASSSRNNRIISASATPKNSKVLLDSDV